MQIGDVEDSSPRGARKPARDLIGQMSCASPGQPAALFQTEDSSSFTLEGSTAQASAPSFDPNQSRWSAKYW